MKKGNLVSSESFTITLSTTSVQILDEIAKRGIWGRNRPEVAARFIDRALESFANVPKIDFGDLKVAEKRGRKK
jgi:hypothetical protein